MLSICSLSAQVNQKINYNPRKSPQSKIEPRIHIVSVPKSGTHLLAKICDLFDFKWDFEHGKYHFLVRKKKLDHGKKLSEIFKPDHKYILLYRDPRDLIISQIFYKMHPDQKHQTSNYHKFKELNFSQLINRSLNAENFALGKIGRYAEEIYDSLDMLLLLKKHSWPNLHFVKFEDLVPSFSGGVSDERRMEVLRNLCQFADMEVSDQEIKKVMDKSWGGTITFKYSKQSRSSDDKKVGQWIKYFNASDIETFQRKYNPYLLELGYESDPNWHLKFLHVNEKSEIETAL